MDLKQFRNLSEKQRRLIAGEEAFRMGRGGITAIANKYKMSRTTVRRGLKEYKNGDVCKTGDRIRKAGAGRKKATETYPELEQIIIRLVNPNDDNTTYGSPTDERKWTTLSTRKIAKILKDDHGIDISYKTVGRILKKTNTDGNTTVK